MKLNLEAKTKEQQRIKAYLEENASDILAGKINNGVLIKKDGKILLNRKTLDGFMSFATEEARKQAEKGARYAMVEDDVVFGWAVHYFEEETASKARSTTTTAASIKNRQRRRSLSRYPRLQSPSRRKSRSLTSPKRRISNRRKKKSRNQSKTPYRRFTRPICNLRNVIPARW